MLNVGCLSKADAASLLELIHDATQCADSDQFADLVSALQTLLPLEAVGALLCKSTVQGHPESVVCLNISLPEEFITEYFSRNYISTDPVVRDNMGVPELHYWGDSFERYGTPGGLIGLARDIGLNLSAKGNGYAHGLTNFSATEHGMISFYGLQRSQRTETILSLLVPCLQEAMKIIRNPPSRAPSLTLREREILKWCASGKSAWEVSEILKISERTVKFHLAGIMTKLDAVNRTHAVAIALREKIISLD